MDFNMLSRLNIDSQTTDTITVYSNSTQKEAAVQLSTVIIPFPKGHLRTASEYKYG